MKFLLVFLIVSIGLPAHAGTVSGIPIIADADTVEFLPEKKRVRLLDMDAPYRSGLSKTWVKAKNPESAAVRREREEEWR